MTVLFRSGSPRRLVSSGACALTLAGLLTTAGVVSAASSSAAVAASSCTATAAQIYAPPADVSNLAPGTVIACRKTAASTTAVVPVTGYQMQYVTTNKDGHKVTSTGITLVPFSLLGPGSLRQIAYSSTTVGLGPQCAASKQFAYGFVDDFEVTFISDLLNDGYAVTMSDGLGYTDGSVHSYVVGKNNGAAQLDAARASRRLPGVGLNPSGKVALAGYSEGGHSTLWAAQLAHSYAPDLNIIGAAAGDSPSDLRAVGKALDGSAYAGFLADAVVGLSSAYPEMPFNSLLNDAGKAAIANVKGQCLVGTLAAFLLKSIKTLNNQGLDINGIFDVTGPNGVTWGQVADQQKVAVGVGRVGSGAQYEIGFPLYNYWSANDDVIPPDSIKAGADRYCAAGVVQRRYVSSLQLHATNLVASGGSVRDWLKARFAGQPETGNC